MDRQNPLLRKKYNDHHPAVLRMIQMVIEAGHAENRRVCICGELAADTALTEEFLRMGVDCLSVVRHVFAGKKSTETGGSVRR